MALLNFPPSPLNNQLYPTNPLPGQNQYRYDATNQTWVLEGTATAVAPGCYGDAYTVPTFCVDAQGRLTFAQNVAIGVTGGTVTDITAGFGLLGGTITTSGTISLDTSFTDSLYLQLAGGTMAGDIIFSGTQSFPGVLPLTGGTMTGDITFSGTQTFPNTVTSVTAGIGLLGGTITTTGTIDLDTAYTDTLYLSLAGGTMTGDITFSGTQTFSGTLPLAGGTMTGDITFSGTQTFPPQTLDDVTTAGNTTTNSIDVGGLTAAGLVYPSVDGAAGDYLSTDGGGNLSWVTPPTETLQSVTDNGATTTNSIDVAGLTAAGLIYPASDGTAGQAMTTDGAGNLGWFTPTRVVGVPSFSTDPGNVGDVAFSNQYFYWYDSGFGWRRVLGSSF